MTSRNKDLPWYRRSVIYQIYPWSFKDSNGDGIGDLQGIIDKLDYLSETLGVGAIWISPIYPSPMKDFGYDISDYCDIDPRFGNLEIFDELVKQAHLRGIKIIMDLVTNHTSDQHPWFLESRSSKENRKRDWYIWHDPKPDGSPPNNWLSVSGGSIWTMDQKTGQYYLHNFMAEQPDLNWRNKEVRREMKNIVEFWIKRGVNGFRVDAASHFVEDSHFRDDPENPDYIAGTSTPYDKLSHIYSTNQPETKEVLGMLCEIAEHNKDIFIVSETYLGLDGIKKFYEYCNNPLHAPFNFLLMDLPWEARLFRETIDCFEGILRPVDVPIYAMGNHDRPRLASRRTPAKARAMALLLLTLRGTPFVYYGEELGMQDVALPPSALRDGFISTLGNHLSRDPERTPMQWNSGANAGFSKSLPWLPISPDYKKVNVESEKTDSRSFLNLYQTLIKFRNESSALLTGSYGSRITTSKDIFAYVRESATEKLLILINFSGQPVSEPLGDAHEHAKYEIIATSLMDRPHTADPKKLRDVTKSISSITLRPYEACLLRMEKQAQK